MVPGGIGEGDSYGGYRAQLVETLRGKGIRDLAVLRAVAQVPRHVFVPQSLRHRAYDDAALPIGSGQTISQPWVQARYLEAIGLSGRERVLEIGTGSGYQTALLALLTDAVFSVERVPALSQSARTALEAAGIRNVTLLVGDGTLGWRPFAPYDAILVSAASPEVPGSAGGPARRGRTHGHPDRRAGQPDADAPPARAGGRPRKHARGRAVRATGGGARISEERMS